MKFGFTKFAATLIALVSLPVLAGGGGPMAPAQEYDVNPVQITLREAEYYFDQGVQFFDVNTLEVWSRGYIPNAVFFNRENWRTLLPADKNTVMVFYCENRLCTQSEMAAREVLKLGYKNVLQMPDGIQGWVKAGNDVERP